MRRHGAEPVGSPGRGDHGRPDKGGAPGRLAMGLFAILAVSTVWICWLLTHQQQRASQIHTFRASRSSVRAQEVEHPALVALQKYGDQKPEFQKDQDRMCVPYAAMGGCHVNETLRLLCPKTCPYFLGCTLCDAGRFPPDTCKSCIHDHALPTECMEDTSEVGRRIKRWEFPPSHIDRRLELPSSAQVVLELGGNMGDDLAAFVRSSAAATRIFSCEPVPDFYSKLEETYAATPRVTILRFGVGDQDLNTSFKLGGLGGQASGGLNDGSHLLAEGKKVDVVLRDASAVLADIEAMAGRPVDTMSINCEGCEYGTLRRMHELGLLPHLAYLQVSWHVVDVEDRVAKRCKIERALRETHDLLWYDGFYGWQGWRRRDAPAAPPLAI